MLSTLKIYESLHNSDFSEKQAKALTECLEVFEKTILNYPNDYSTKIQLNEVRLELKSDIRLMDKKIEYLDQKIDIQRSELTKSLDRQTHFIMAGFALIFATLGYLIFKI